MVSTSVHALYVVVLNCLGNNNKKKSVSDQYRGNFPEFNLASVESMGTDPSGLGADSVAKAFWHLGGEEVEGTIPCPRCSCPSMQRQTEP